MEMVKFGKLFFSKSVHTATFTEESAGVADLITSCSGGRNYRCAKMSVEKNMSIDIIEKEELNGQLLQGTLTAKEVYGFLKVRNKEDEFPLFTAVHRKVVPSLHRVVGLTAFYQASFRVRLKCKTCRI